MEMGCIGSSDVEVSEGSLGEMLLVKVPDSVATWVTLALISITYTSLVGIVDAKCITIN
jgi:hypothetical protein